MRHTSFKSTNLGVETLVALDLLGNGVNCNKSSSGCFPIIVSVIFILLILSLNGCLQRGVQRLDGLLEVMPMALLVGELVFRLVNFSLTNLLFAP